MRLSKFIAIFRAPCQGCRLALQPKTGDRQHFSAKTVETEEESLLRIFVWQRPGTLLKWGDDFDD
jgi:hypothetical protein